MIPEPEEPKRSKAFRSLFQEYEGPPFSIRLWDGWHWHFPEDSKPACTIVFQSAAALESLIARPSEITLGDAFRSKEIDVEGDLFSVFAVTDHVFHGRGGQRRRILEGIAGSIAEIGLRWKAGRLHSPERDRAAISYHYDQPVDFYRPWLGESLAYSCAYFQSSTDTIDTAQVNKLELICRKLRLRPGERLLDIGCGWGGLILHAASRHGVHAQGITLSREQAAVTASRIEEARLDQFCEVELLDYRKASSRFPAFDKISSVGMFEHVGLKNLPLYFQTAYELLKPGGVFLNHGIARAPSPRDHGSSFLDGSIVPFLRNVLKLSRPRSSSFIGKYVFPDGDLVTLAQALRAAGEAGFEVRDVENLREHYELTLRAWVERLQRNAALLRNQVSETTYRTWLLYMAGSAAAFRRGDLCLYQVLLSRPDRGRSRVPLTREDWYLRSLSHGETDLRAVSRTEATPKTA